MSGTTTPGAMPPLPRLSSAAGVVGWASALVNALEIQMRRLTAQPTSYVAATVAVGSAVAAATGVTVTVTSIVVPAGVWDISGTAWLSGAGTVTAVQAGINTTATLPGDSTVGSRVTLVGTLTGTAQILPLAPFRFTFLTTTTVYLVADITYSTTGATAYGSIAARLA